PVDQKEETREPSLTLAAAAIAFLIPAASVTLPALWNTATSGACSPVPKVLSVLWFASYAEYPGIEKLSNQRLETWPAEKPPNRVSTTQAPITARRRRTITWASRASMLCLLPAAAPATQL